MRSPAALSLVLGFAQLCLRVSAHGFPSSVQVNGKTYPGSNGQNASPSSSPIRKVLSGDPVTDPTSDAIKCGTNAELAPLSLSAAPGDQLFIYWSAEGGGNWFHNTGPIMTYIAQCSGSCESFTPDTSTNWYKIDEEGQVNGKWVQANLNSGAPANVTIPQGLAAGNYLMRHEIIALQNAVAKGGTEYYPGCIQMTITGSGKGSMSPSVHFPGAYSETDPGILGNFYDPGVVYQFPGGPVASVSGSGGSGSGGSSASSPSGTDAPSASATVRVKCKASKKGQLKRRSSKRTDPLSPEASKRRVLDLHHKQRLARSLF